MGFVFAILVSGLAPSVHAQYPGYVTDSNDTGLPTYGSFISSQVDMVNLGTGGLSIRVPIVSRKGRGIDYLYVETYESKLWTMVPTVTQLGTNYPITTLNWVPDQSPGANWTARDNVHASVDWTEQTYTCAPTSPQGGDAGGEVTSIQSTFLVRSNWIYKSPDGAKHQVPLRNNYPIDYPGQCGDSGPGNTNVVANTDNDHVQVDISQDTVEWHTGILITGADGTQYTPYNLGQEDRNGNICCAGGISNPWITDTLGRPLWAYDPASTGSEYIYDVYDSNGNVQKIKVDFISINVAPAFPTTSYDQYHPVTQYAGSITVVSKITLANGLAYTFSYADPNNPGQTNPFGEVTEITLPTGGYVKYKWITIPQADQGPQDPVNPLYLFNIDARRIAERDVSEDGVTEQVWTYTYPGAAGNQNSSLGGSIVVTDPLGNSEGHSFGACGVQGFFNNFNAPSLDLGVTYSNSAGKVLKQVVTNWACDWGPVYIAYQGMNLPNNNAELTENVRNARIVNTITTLADTNQVSQVQSAFGDCYTYTIYVSTRTDCRDNPTQTSEYDYGNGAPGPLLRYTNFTYYHNSNSAYLNAHIWDLVAQKSVYDGGNNLVASTQYSYDTTSITPTSGVPQHDTNYSSSNTVRGNPTIVSRWLNTTSSSLTTTNYYNDVGNLVQTTDPAGHTYTLSYADNFTDGTNRNSQGYLTSVTSPATNGVNHVEGKQYYWYTGLTAAVCGQNAPSPGTCSNLQSIPAPDYASYTYDLMGRPLSVTHGDGGTTAFTFSDLTSTSTPITVSSNSAIDGSNTLVNTAVIDGLGRVSQTQLNSDPDGVDYVDTTYDSAGRKSTVSNPHRSSSSSTDGITTYNYDGLSRTTQVIPPDGSASANNVATLYSGNTVIVTDQAGKQRRSVTDGLGRLIEVDEPSAPSGATNSNGYVQVNGTELWGGGAAATATVGFSGYENSGPGNPTCNLYDCGGNCIEWGNAPTIYDQGYATVTVNSHTYSLGYGPASTPSNMASGLVYMIGSDPSAVVTATLPYIGATSVSLTAKTHGPNYSLSTNSWTTDTTGTFNTPSFYASSSSTISGGVYDWADTGTISLSVGGVQNSVTYGNGSTASGLASALATAVNGNSSSLVTASASGGTINFTDKTQGSAISLSVSSISNYPATFSPISFPAAASDEFLNPYATAPPASLLTPMVTLYTYNALDDLVQVQQQGNTSDSTQWRTRTFVYDSLSRLASATNPESGTISYTYDADGNVLTKTDARSITTTMTYDALNRVLSKSYSDSTPAASFVYDISSTNGVTMQNPIGRLVMAQTSGSTYNYVIHSAYDPMGRLATDLRWNSARAALGICCAYVLGATYNYAGGITADSNEFFTISQLYDPAARLKQLTSSLSDSQHPATLLSVDQTVGYTPAGALAKATYGNGLVETDAYNNRLQPSQLLTYNPNNNNAAVLNLSYGFTASDDSNNGNLVSLIFQRDASLHAQLYL